MHAHIPQNHILRVQMPRRHLYHCFNGYFGSAYVRLPVERHGRHGTASVCKIGRQST
jgi:hypothetical protein